MWNIRTHQYSSSGLDFVVHLLIPAEHSCIKFFNTSTACLPRPCAELSPPRCPRGGSMQMLWCADRFLFRSSNFRGEEEERKKKKKKERHVWASCCSDCCALPSNLISADEWYSIRYSTNIVGAIVSAPALQIRYGLALPRLVHAWQTAKRGNVMGCDRQRNPAC